MRKSSYFLGILLLVVFSCSKKTNIYSFDLIPVKIEDKWGFIDKTGKIVINPIFDYAYYFSEDLALIRDSLGKHGYIDKTGKIIIKPSFKKATSFHENIAFVVNENDYPEAITRDGKVLFKLSAIDYINTFREGLALAKSRDLFGFINKNGKATISYQFSHAGSFSEGLACVAIESKTKSGDTESQYGYIDKNGKVIINPQFDEGYSFNEGLALVYNGEKYGYIDKTGKYLINPQFDDASSFSEGLAPIKQGEKWGYIDKNGKIAINPQFATVRKFKNGLAAVTNSNEEWGFINKKGAYEINPQFSSASNFISDFAFIFSKDKAGLISKDGKFIVNPQYDDVPDHYKTFFFEIAQTQEARADYFDTNKIFEKFLDKSDELQFKGLSNATTAVEIMSTGTKKDEVKELTSYSLYTDEIENISDDVKVTEKIFTFKSKVYWYAADYYLGYYMGSKKKYNYSAKIKRVLFEFYLPDYGIGEKRENYFAEKLAHHLRDKFNAALNDDVALIKQEFQVSFAQHVDTSTLDTKANGFINPVEKEDAFQSNTYDLESSKFIFLITTRKKHVDLIVTFK